MASLSEHRGVLIGLAILVALGISVAVLWPSEDVAVDDSDRRTDRAGSSDDDDGYFEDGPSSSDPRAFRGGRDGREIRGEPGVSGPRGESRDRVGERAERWRSEVEVAVLGPSSRALDPEQLVAPLEEGMDELAACMERHGGRRAFRDATRLPEQRPTRPPEGTPEGTTRMRRRSRFDIRADGTVDPASLEFEPPIPAPFAECFEQHLANARFPPPGGDGVRIDMPIRRPRREPRAVGEDGGVSTPRR